MEVIYTGLHQTPEQIVETVIQEDADAVGLSILSGAHMTLVPRIVELLREQGIDDVAAHRRRDDPRRRHPRAQAPGGGRGLHARRPDAGHHRLHPGRRRGADVALAGDAGTATGPPRRCAGLRSTDPSVNELGSIEPSFARGGTVKIAVLVKEVPDAAVQKRIDPATGRMDRSGEKNLNPYDTHAIEAAMQLKEGGAVEVDEIVAVTMGPDSAQRALHKAVSLGADRSVHLSDDALAGSDVAATGYALAQALRRESPDLVLLGQQSDDGECYTIGAVVADHLQMPSLTQVIKMDVDGEALRCERQAEYGYDTVQVQVPGRHLGRRRDQRAALPVAQGDHGRQEEAARQARRRRRRHRPVARSAPTARRSTAGTSRPRRPRPAARSSRTRTPTTRSRRSSPGSTRGSSSDVGHPGVRPPLRGRVQQELPGRGVRGRPPGGRARRRGPRGRRRRRARRARGHARRATARRRSCAPRTPPRASRSPSSTSWPRP